MQKINTRLNNEKGLAMIETLPLVVIFVVIFSFALGFFGVVHTAIMNSMGARAYAFETFRNRADTGLFRDRKANGALLQHFDMGNRLHAINSETKLGSQPDLNIYATTRPIAIGRDLANSSASELDHNINIYNISGRNRKGRGVEASPAWIMVSYGLCINAGCGD